MARKTKSGLRTANGRLSRAKGARYTAPEPPASQAVIEMRMRLYGLTENQAKDQKAATAVGRLVLTRKLLPEHFLAASRYLDARRNYLTAVACRSDVESGGAGGGGDDVTDGFVEWCERAKTSWGAIMETIEAAQICTRRRNLYAALDVVVVRDEVRQDMTADVSIALSAVALRLGIASECRGIDIGCEAA